MNHDERSIGYKEVPDNQHYNVPEVKQGHFYINQHFTKINIYPLKNIKNIEQYLFTLKDSKKSKYTYSKENRMKERHHRREH